MTHIYKMYANLHAERRTQQGDTPHTAFFSVLLGSIAPAEYSPWRGIGLRAHVEFLGQVPLLTKIPGSGKRVPLFINRACFVRSNWRGNRWNSSSVSETPGSAF